MMKRLCRILVVCLLAMGFSLAHADSFDDEPSGPGNIFHESDNEFHPANGRAMRREPAVGQGSIGRFTPPSGGHSGRVASPGHHYAKPSISNPSFMSRAGQQPSGPIIFRHSPPAYLKAPPRRPTGSYHTGRQPGPAAWNAGKTYQGE